MQISLFLFIIGLLLVFAGRFVFRQWTNPLSLYIVPWTVVLAMYHLKFMIYDDLCNEAWAVIIVSLISFILGVVLVFPMKELNIKTERSSTSMIFFGFTDNQFKFLIFCFGFLGLIGSLQHWSVLLKMFGGIQEVLLSANIIYSMRVQGSLPEVLPYLSFFSYAGILLVGARIAFRGKFGWLDTLPMISLLLKEMANFGREGLLQGFSELFIGFIICRTILRYQKIKSQKINVKNFLLSFLLLATLLVGSSTAVRFFRGTTENFKQSSRELGLMKSNIILTPSIYLYASGHVGVLSKYLYLNNENASFGENTFLPIYHLLTKFQVVDKSGFYQKPYYIPIWINTGTYLREVHADFGSLGVLLVPFLLGFFSTYYWFKIQHNGSAYQFVILAGLLNICVMSFLMMITRGANFALSHILLLISFWLLRILPKITNHIKSKLINGQIVD